MNTTPSSTPRITFDDRFRWHRGDADATARKLADARPAGRRHTTGGQLTQASLGSRRRRSGRQCVGARSHRRPVRCRGRCHRGRSHHRDVGRIDGGCPDHQRDTAGRTVCRHPRRGASATGRRRRIGQGTRSESLGAELPGVVERNHRFCRGCVRHAPQDGRRGTRDGCFRRLWPDALARHRRGSASQPRTGRNSPC